MSDQLPRLVYGLYPPGNIDARWECVSMGGDSAGPTLRAHTVPAAWGNPCRAVAWFDDNAAARLRVLVAEYANGRRAVLRLRPDLNWNITMTTIPIGPAANWPRHYTREMTA